MLAVSEAVQSGSQGCSQVKVFWMMPADFFFQLHLFVPVSFENLFAANVC